MTPKSRRKTISGKAKHFKKGSPKVLEQSIEKGREKRKKLDYYKENRSDLIQNFSRRPVNPKKTTSRGLIVLQPIHQSFYSNPEQDQINEADETAEEALKRILSEGSGAENRQKEESEESKGNPEQD